MTCIAVCRALLGLCLLLAPTFAAPAPGVLLDETFGPDHAAWREDDYSRIEKGGYVIDATGTGGSYRWLEQPDETTRFGDFQATVTVQKLRGNNDQPLYGLLFRVQQSWRDSYFFVVNGAGEYFCGKFLGGTASILKQGSHDAIARAGSANQLGVRAAGPSLAMLANGKVVAEVEDSSFRDGRIGLCVEAPAAVRFDDLRVTALGGELSANSPAGPAPATDGALFRDDFAANRGWSTDPYRKVSDGVYHLQNAGEHKSYVSWHPSTSQLTDLAMQASVRRLDGDPKALYGLVWHVLDGDRFYFFLIGADGRYYAGLSTPDGIEVKSKGRAMAIRAGREENTLRVSATGPLASCAINGITVAEFRDGAYPAGAVGFYLEQPGHVTFDDLLVTAPTAATAAGGGATGSVGKLLLEDPLVTATSGWPEDEHHVFDLGGYCVRAPDDGSRTVIHLGSLGQGDGVYEVSARPVQGNLSGSYGMVVRANKQVDTFLFLLLNATGAWVVGECQDGKFASRAAGTIAQLRGGTEGNRFRIALRDGTLTYGINDETLGTLKVPARGTGAVGLHVENGVVACFRKLSIHAAGEVR